MESLDTLILVGALSLMAERFAEIFVVPFLEGSGITNAKTKVGVTGLATLGVGFALAFALDLRLFIDLLPSAELGSDEDKILTALVIGGGSDPAHEFLRYIQEKKGKASEEKEATKLDKEAKDLALEAARAATTPPNDT